MAFNFYKFSGSGNDFIIIDNRNKIVDERNLSDFVVNVCRRKMSVGADGLILVEESDKADFRWQFFNSDGSRAEMCGNGARCAARFAYINGIAGTEMAFETDVGIISAYIADDQVKIKMTDPTDLRTDYAIQLEKGPLSVSSVNTGVPHIVLETSDTEPVEVVRTGREIRFHKSFAPAGTNVNFVCGLKDGSFANRTYERGVEDETLACGTGCVASAIIMAYKYGTDSPIDIITKSGGRLIVHYKEKNGRFYDIYLEGDARIIYKGEFWEGKGLRG
ncbi:diaminopimelate epimerase [Desulfobacterales bacterium HSG2]|nr:diaminopimelate epimerase [Desulfobacterales bacterium HSG2]